MDRLIPVDIDRAVLLESQQDVTRRITEAADADVDPGDAADAVVEGV
ncbi:hypothetical protein [Streptomyces capoamus]|nr:hypothetical protein [Streptomyces capoamus]